MRYIYAVAYDVADDKRVKTVFKKMKNWGDHTQYSLFFCHLNDTELATLKVELDSVIDSSEDQIMFIKLGPEGGRVKDTVFTLGRPWVPTSRTARVF